MAGAEGVEAVRSAVIHYTEMNEAEQTYVIESAMRALGIQDKGDHSKYHKDLAHAIKTDMESFKGGAWHVAVGRSFGSFVSHETKNIIFFSVGDIKFFIWKHG